MDLRRIAADDTIVAIASGRGPGNRGVVRMSGNEALAIGTRVFACDLNNAIRGKLFPCRFSLDIGSGNSRDSLLVVTGMVLVWPDGRSYTGQRAVELHTSVPQPVMDQIVQACSQQGARLAQPGEFTMRAFVAGRMDLTQAEAVLGLIHARNDKDFSTALSQLAGGLAIPFAEIRETLLILLADLEAGLDFVEDDIEFIDRERLASSIDFASSMLQRLRSQMVSRSSSELGYRVVLAGLPNSGKSSLFNMLVGRNAAIVSDTKGTTRDYLCHRIGLDAIVIDLFDTAGIELNSAADKQLWPDQSPAISSDGMAGEKTRQAISGADLVLYCVDISSSNASGEFAGALDLTVPTLVVATKTDLSDSVSTPRGTAPVSSVTGAGVAELREKIIEKVIESSQTINDVVPATLLRCGQALDSAISELHETSDAMNSGAGDEIVAAGLRAALEYIGAISGDVCTDDILDRIFSRFCIGK